LLFSHGSSALPLHFSPLLSCIAASASAFAASTWLAVEKSVVSPICLPSYFFPRVEKEIALDTEGEEERKVKRRSKELSASLVVDETHSD
jgi:hypothetical protein